jgi:hypothetical protein
MSNGNGRTPPTPSDPFAPEALRQAAATPADPFDLEALRLPQNFSDGLGVKKVLVTLAVRKPGPQWFFRTHPTMRMQAAVIEIKDENETHLVAGTLLDQLVEEVTIKELVLAITRQGNPFIWPLRLPDSTGRLDDWSRSAIEAAKHAEKVWTRMQSNRHAGCYQVSEATGIFPEPVWPDKPLIDLLRVAFKGRFIDSVDHPVIAQLQGRV